MRRIRFHFLTFCLLVLSSTLLIPLSSPWFAVAASPAVGEEYTQYMPIVHSAASPLQPFLGLTFLTLTDTREIYTMRADGSEVNAISDDPAINESAPQWSPDGTKILYKRYDETAALPLSLVVSNNDGSVQTTIASFSQVESRVETVWSPDNNTMLVISYIRDQHPELPIPDYQYIANFSWYYADGTPPQHWATDLEYMFAGQWAPDGEHIYIITANNMGLGLLVVAKDGTTHLVAPNVYGDLLDWSPDGTWLGYQEAVATEPELVPRVVNVRDNRVLPLDGQGNPAEWLDATRLIMIQATRLVLLTIPTLEVQPLTTGGNFIVGDVSQTAGSVLIVQVGMESDGIPTRLYWYESGGTVPVLITERVCAAGQCQFESVAFSDDGTAALFEIRDDVGVHLLYTDLTTTPPTVTELLESELSTFFKWIPQSHFISFGDTWRDADTGRSYDLPYGDAEDASYLDWQYLP